MSEPTTDARDGILGIHHITALASDPQANLDFYAGLLGLRLVKKTVNFDDPGTYHFYYGDDAGRPGTILTFFPWPNARRGALGAGQTRVVRFAVPAGSLDFWQQRLREHGIGAGDRGETSDGETLRFRDPDGMGLELVADAVAAERPAWSTGPVPRDKAIRGFHGVEFLEADPQVTAEVLVEHMGFRAVEASSDRGRNDLRFEIGRGADTARIDLVATRESQGRVAAGSVHHIAWRVADDAREVAWRERLQGLGHHITEVLDRQYFHSVYFREPGGVLFELATDPPGFELDESYHDLGSGLMLPPWLEGQRERIETLLPPVTRPCMGHAIAADEITADEIEAARDLVGGV